MHRILHKWKTSSSFFIMSLFLLILPLTFTFCQRKTNIPVITKEAISPEVFNRGKNDNLIPFVSFFKKDTTQIFQLKTNFFIQNALITQKKYLTYTPVRETQVTDSLTITKEQLKNSIQILSTLNKEEDTLSKKEIKDHFELYQLSGDDSLGNVLFTGYYTPVIKVKSKKDSLYKYPFYKNPGRKNGFQLPERREIDYQNALVGKGLEIAWSQNLFDNFVLQVQGSGIVEFEDQTTKILSYGGKNGHPYSSIGKHLIKLNEIEEKNISLSAIRNWLVQHQVREKEILSVNKSHIFFKLNEPIPKRAASVKLTPGYSVAVDTEYIPLGSILLAQIPLLDESRKFVEHQFKILFAQDRGGAIKGPGRIDSYCEIGEKGIKMANSLNYYGKI